jgi:response regulator RpfG family c-di-GMP phosphodiesterase
MDETKGRVLVVDDEESIRSILSRKLETEGYYCVTAADGKEAIETASQQDFDLVLTDVKMPGMSGIEVLSNMVADHPDTAVIMITAVSDAQAAVEAMKMGAYDYVTKPFDLEALGMRVEKALERRRLVLENRDYQQRLEHRVEQQVGQMQQYYKDAIHALAREEIALQVLDATRQTGSDGMTAGHESEADSRESSRPVKEFVSRLADLPEDDGDTDSRRGLELAKVLALMAETREPYARGHSERVNMLANEIAVQMGYPDDQIRCLELAAIVHDIGKIVVPDHVLFKPGTLTPAEHNEVKRHPVASVEILRHVDCFSEVLPIVESHHEWFNGKGYPSRQKGDAIPLGARIVAVADAYDAMTCSRPHRARLSNEEAIQVLKKGAGKQWDPTVVEAFVRILERESRMLQDSLLES